MAAKNNPIVALQKDGFKITSNPANYKEWYPDGPPKPWGQRDLEGYNRENVDAWCRGKHPAFDLAKSHGARIDAFANMMVLNGTGWNTFGNTFVGGFFDAKGVHYQVIIGHLNQNPLDYLSVGDILKVGDIMGYQGNSNNIGVNNMDSHVHIQFQIYKALNEWDFTCTGLDPLDIDISVTHATKPPVKKKAPAKDVKPEAKPAVPKADNSKVMIIDVSQFQDPNAIKYPTLSKQIDAAIIRTMDADYEDTAYGTHHKKFQEQGVPTMAYAFVRGTTIQQMKNEAKMFYDRTKKHNPTFWWLDVETISMPKASQMRAAVSAYIKELRRLGAKKVGLYIAHHLYKQLNLNVAEADAVWIPHYGNGSATANSKPDFPADIHQYTEHGRLPGYNGDLDLNRLIGDKPLEFFTDGKSSKVKPAAPTQSTKPVAAPKAKTYKVKPGDTLSGIAVYTGIPQVRLQSLNGIIDPNILNAGTVLKLTGTVTAQKASGTKYRIKPGDTLSGIAAANGTTVAALRKLNAGIKNSDVIYAGNDLVLPGKSAAPKAKAVYHNVVWGDTVDALANRYGSTRKNIVSWNKLPNANAIYAGQKLRVK